MRDPHTPGYVKATEPPDALCPNRPNGNFIIGPTYRPAPEVADPNPCVDGTVVDDVSSSCRTANISRIAQSRLGTQRLILQIRRG